MDKREWNFEPNMENAVLIESVSSFLEKLKDVLNKADGDNSVFFFRGQKTEFWDLQPSIFRDAYVSVEHLLMQDPLLKVPHEFNNSTEEFEILTKYQHYGMCTRLLDLTINPLVALYFACEKHGDVEYREDVEMDGEKKEPYGVVYFNCDYPIRPNDQKIRIVSALTMLDLEKENTLIDILNYLHDNGIITEKQLERWKTKQYYQEFVQILQTNYVVVPANSNERLSRQNGMFLLASCFNVQDAEEPKKCVINKGIGNLRSEFEETVFLIRGDCKEEILKELDMYNINEATLFPELEHQLNYIKHTNQVFTKSAVLFNKFEKNVDVQNVKEMIVIGANMEKFNTEFAKGIKNIISDENLRKSVCALVSKDAEEVDWYKRESVLSRMRLKLMEQIISDGKDVVKAKSLAKQIVDLAVEIITREKTSQED